METNAARGFEIQCGTFQAEAAAAALVISR